MSRWVIAVVLVGMLMPMAAWCQEETPQTDLEHEMQVQRMELEMEQQRAEAEFQREMRTLELEARRLDLEQRHGREGGGAALLLIICGVVHILVAIWIYQDIRQRSAGSGLWIVLGLLAGLLAALVYGVVRLGDIDEGKKKARN